LVLALAQQQVRKAHPGGPNVDDDVVTVAGDVVDVRVDNAVGAAQLLYDTGFHDPTA
jgi:hypothetical protein